MQSHHKKTTAPPKLVVTLTESGVILRVFFMILALAVASYAFYAVFTNVLHTESGWNTVTVQKPTTTASREFSFEYEFGVSGTPASTEWPALHKQYSFLLDHYYQVFSTEEYEGISNLYTLSTHPNEVVTLEPELYDGLALLEQDACRWIFYAPLFEIYRGLAGCGNDWEAAAFDPTQNEDVRNYLLQVISFASDPKSIRLELSGDGKACLRISNEYLSFAKENELASFVDLYVWKNAFVLDALADRLAELGYTAGILTTTDGYSRTLSSGNFSVKLLKQQDDGSILIDSMDYTGPKSIVSLHTYPTSSATHFYTREDGTVLGPFIDLTTGLCISEPRDLTVLSDQHGCSELLLLIWDGFVTGTTDSHALSSIGIRIA